ncbi:hypothetical protein AB6D20_027560 (plasmid) [Vibrio splendidus]
MATRYCQWQQDIAKAFGGWLVEKAFGGWLVDNVNLMSITLPKILCQR